MIVGLVEDAVFLEHSAGAGHPERPERLAAISDAVRTLPFADELVRLPIRDARREELDLVHGAAYLDLLEQSRMRDLTVLDADTQASAASWGAALRAAGGALAATEEALVGTVTRSFVLCRPPGHHTEHSRAMGFCLINNVAVAAAGALASGVARRVAIVDWDVHHGNGTAHTFGSRRDVLYISTHQWPHYPGTGSLDDVGSGEGEGYTVNLPLPAGCGDSEYLAVFDAVVLPVLEAYAPDLVLVSAGFDPHERDPLSGMRVTRAGFAGMTQRLVSTAEAVAGGRIVHVLEGGYDLQGLADGVSAVLEVLTGHMAPEPAAVQEPHGTAGATVHRVLQAVRTRLRDYWPL